MKRGFKGIWIPKEIWENQSLSIIEKIFLMEIDSLDNEEGCFASNNYFANFFNISRSRCTQIIASLKDKKLITVQIIYNGGSVTQRIIRVVNKFNTPGKFIKSGWLENSDYNNTRNKKNEILKRNSISREILIWDQ